MKKTPLLSVLFLTAGLAACGGSSQEKGTVLERPSSGLNIYYKDADGDGYGSRAGSIVSVSMDAGFVANADDCDDSNAAIHPGAAELIGDVFDNDCDGQVNDKGPYFSLSGKWSDIGSSQNSRIVSISSTTPLDAGKAFLAADLAKGLLLDPDGDEADDEQIQTASWTKGHVWTDTEDGSVCSSPAGAQAEQVMFLEYDKSNPDSDCSGYVKAAQLVPGKGYIVSIKSAGEFRQVLGVPPSGAVSVSVSAGWNLLGNPLNEDIRDLSAAIGDAASEVDGQIFIYNNGYTGAPLKSPLKRFSGFFVKFKHAVIVTFSPGH